MPNNSLSREMALRIGLAARALPEVTPAALLGVLEGLVGLPPGEQALQALRVRDLRDAFETATKQDLAAALAHLKGEAADEAVPPPLLEKSFGGLRVACASNGGEALDGHFGSCARFLVYEVTADATRLVDVRSAEVDDRAALIADCSILFVVSIGGPAAAKVVNCGIHPVRIAEGGSARDVAAALSARLAASPPRWLVRAQDAAA